MVTQKVTTLSANMAIGELAANLGFFVISAVFVMAFCATSWQMITVTTAAILSAMYLLCMLVYASHGPACTKSFGIFTFCFHALRCTALFVAITVAL